MHQLVARGIQLIYRSSGDARRAGQLAIAMAAALVAAALVLAPAVLGASTFQFGAAVPYATGKAPQAIAAADLNGDGKPDIVTADAADNTVSVLLSKGAGFAAQVAYATGETPDAVAVADVNGDGKPDIVTADSGSNSVSVLLGKGDGTFAAPVEYATGEAPAAVALGDLNGDGKPDIVTANSGQNSVSVLLGKGDGTFAAPVEYATGEAPAAVALADLNGDGKPDVVTANSAANTVSVLLGNGDGTFAAKQDFTTGTTPRGVAVADLNADGKPDVVTANSAANTVSVLLGNGDGTFAAKQDFITGTTPQGVAVADLNADGRLDIVTADSGGSAASVLLGKGDGTFAAKQDFTTGAAPQAVALPDLGGDGEPDIVTANATDNDVSVLLNTSVGALELSPNSLTFSPQLFGTKSPSQKVSVTNTGSAAVTISSVTVTGNFRASGCTGSSATLAAGASCSLSVTFSPKGYGSLKGEVTIATSAGSKAIKLSGTGLPPAPLATTGPVGEIIGGYVTLTGGVVSQGPGSFYFEYGTSTAYGSVTPTLPLGSGASPQLLTATLSLQPGMTYHYRIVATNLVATVRGADQVFTIPPESPLLSALRHGHLRSVLKRGLRLRVSDASPATIDLTLWVDAHAARAAHLIPRGNKRKAKVRVASVRVIVAADRSKTVTVKFDAAIRRKLAALRRLRLTLSAVARANGLASVPTSITAVIRR